MSKMDPKRAAEARNDLRTLHGENGFSFATNDGYFANSLITKYGMSLSELEVASGYRKPKGTRKVAKLEAAAEALCRAKHADNRDGVMVDAPHTLWVRMRKVHKDHYRMLAQKVVAAYENA